jgi:hypothetical protein
VNAKADATNSLFMILPRFLVRPCELPVKKDDDHAISPSWYLERAVNAGQGTSADRPAQSIGFHIFLVAAVAGCPQLPDQPSELIQAFGVASFLGELRGGRGALVEIRKVHPESGEAYVSVAGSRSAPGFHWLVPAETCPETTST